MRQRAALVLMGELFLLLFSSCADDDTTQGLCTVEAIESALNAASSGDRITLGACQIEGTFAVPAGVTLAGQGQEATVITIPEGQAGIAVTAGVVPTVITQLTVVSSGNGIIVVGQSGRSEVRNVTVRLSAGSGVALGVRDVSNLTLADVTLVGGGTAETDLTEIAGGYGLVLVDVEAAELTNLSASGFATFGALLVRSTTTWNGGSMADNASVGLMVHEGSASLNQIGIRATRQGTGLIPAYGVVINLADVTTQSLEIADNEGVGLFQSESTASHLDLRTRDNTDVGVWVQRSTRFELSGQDSLVSNNRVAGIVIVDSSNVTLRQALIENTRLGPRSDSIGRLAEMGDGLQLVNSPNAIQLDGLTFDNNARVGLLIDLESQSLADTVITNVTVAGTEDQLGAIAQGGTVPEGWDEGISRSEDVAANDDAFTGDLDIVGLVGPNDFGTPTDVNGLVGPND